MKTIYIIDDKEVTKGEYPTVSKVKFNERKSMVIKNETDIELAFHILDVDDDNYEITIRRLDQLRFDKKGSE